MAFSWSGLVSALETAITTVWPEIPATVGGGGVLEVDKIGRIDFDTLTSGTSSVKAPYAVIEWNPVGPAESPVTGQIYLADVIIHYVTRFTAGGNGVATVRSKLEQLEDYLLTTGLGTNQSVEAVSGLDWSANHPANERFLMANVPWVAGSLTANLLVGEQAA